MSGAALAVAGYALALGTALALIAYRPRRRVRPEPGQRFAAAALDRHGVVVAIGAADHDATHLYAIDAGRAVRLRVETHKGDTFTPLHPPLQLDRGDDVTVEWAPDRKRATR